MIIDIVIIGRCEIIVEKEKYRSTRSYASIDIAGDGRRCSYGWTLHCPKITRTPLRQHNTDRQTKRRRKVLRNDTTTQHTAPFTVVAYYSESGQILRQQLRMD